MNKVWIFFKLRLIQLRYDKTALFFSYFLPIILLTGIGYPIEMAGNRSVDVYLYDAVQSKQSAALTDYLREQKGFNILLLSASRPDFKADILNNKMSHVIEIKPISPLTVAHKNPKSQPIEVVIYSDDSNNHKMETLALSRLTSQFFATDTSLLVSAVYLQAMALNSYIVTLLPGLIGMTLLTIGLNGFGGVLVVEQEAGLFRNIKTIDASPVAFLSGLFLSRLFVSYSVACALYLVGVFVFGLSINVDFLVLFLVITLGCISFLGIGLVIAVLSKSVSAFNGIVNFVNIPFVVFSGVFFSTAAFPNWLQAATQLIPLTHMNAAVKAVLFEQVGVMNITLIGKELVILLVWCAFTLAIGIKKFKW